MSLCLIFPHLGHCKKRSESLGFFVGSVEFCKFKFDDKKDDKKDNNVTGIQGPPGPLSKILQLTTVLVINSTFNPNISLNAQASCDPEDFLLNGGFRFAGNRRTIGSLFAAISTRWKLMVCISPQSITGAGQTTSIEATATCVDIPPPH